MQKFDNRPGLKKNLVQKQKLIIFRLARERFIDQGLRNLEEEAKAGIEVALAERCQELQTEIEILEQHGMVQKHNSYVIQFPFTGVEKKTFELDSKKVTRLTKVQRGAVCLQPYNNTWLEWRQLYNTDTPLINGGQQCVKLSSPLPVITNGSFCSVHFAGEVTSSGYGADKEDEKSYQNALKIYAKDPSLCIYMGNGYTHGKSGKAFLNQKVREAVLKYLEACDVRTRTEYALQKAIFSVIDSAKKFTEIVDVWPEAAEVMDDLFPTQLEKGMSLIPADENVKKLLCANMQSRGIVSPLMCEAGAAA
ncbi:MAG: hypothetical protein JJ979_14895 [Roseibium sp.]|nr:hypothetical protein [Roseibium sp.]